jgi:hypothetical protein
VISNLVVVGDSRQVKGTPRAASGPTSERRSVAAQRATILEPPPSKRKARAAWNGAPPTRGGPPSIVSRARFPITATPRTARL